MIRLSPSSLSVFRDCPRCFWWEQVQKVKRPRGIFPSLPGGIDRVMKAFVDAMLEAQQPIPHIVHLDNAAPYHDRFKIKRWQNWRTGLTWRLDHPDVGEIVIGGALDDLLEWPNGKVSPWDFKSKGSAPKEGDSEIYYGPQLDIYDGLLTAGDMETTGNGYLTYVWPVAVQPDAIKFDTQTIILKTDRERAKDLIFRAVDCINSQAEPEASGQCEYCSYLEQRDGNS